MVRKMKCRTFGRTFGIDLRHVREYKAVTMLPGVLRPCYEVSWHGRGTFCRWAGQLCCPAHAFCGSAETRAVDMRGQAYG